MSSSRCLVVLGAIALLFCGLAEQARAQGQPSMTINLDTGPGEHPKHICIVSNAKARDGAYLYKLGELVEQTEQGRRRAWRFRASANDALADAGCEADQPPEVCQTEKKHPGVWDAFAAMAQNHRRRSGSGAACGGDGTTACEPTFQVAEIATGNTSDFNDLNIVCAENTDVSASPLVGVFLFRFPQKYPLSIQTVTLNTATVTITLAEKFLSGEYVVVSVAGGSYVSWGYSQDAVDRVDVKLQPRCRPHEVQLPPMAPLAGDNVCVRADLFDEQEPDKPLTCTQGPVNRRGKFTMFLPVRAEQRTKMLAATALSGDCTMLTPQGTEGPAEDGAMEPEGRFVAFWNTARPPPLVELEAQSVSFEWEVDCLYGSVTKPADCPRATLPELGVDCVSQPITDAPDIASPVCRYTCSGTSASRAALGFSASGFALPVKVRFERAAMGRSAASSTSGGSRVVWDEELVYINQRLRGYIRPEERFVEIDFSPWLDEVGSNWEAALGRPGDRIEFVEITTPDGRRHTVSPWGRAQRVSAPGVECSDYLGFEVEGQRNHKKTMVQLESGRLVVPPMDDTARIVRFWTGLSVGSMGAPTVTGNNYTLDSGQSVNAAFDFPPKPYLVAHADASFHGLRWPVMLELSFLYVLNEKVYLPTWEIGERPDRESTLYQRYLLALNGVWVTSLPLVGDFYPLVGVGGGWGLPFLRRNQFLNGEPQFLYFAQLGARKPLNNWLQLEATMRVSFDDDTIVNITDFRGAPQRHLIDPVFIGGEAGVRVGW